MDLITIGTIIIAVGCSIGGILIGTGIAWIREAKKINRGSNKSNVISDIMHRRESLEAFMEYVKVGNMIHHYTQVTT